MDKTVDRSYHLNRLLKEAKLLPALTPPLRKSKVKVKIIIM